MESSTGGGTKTVEDLNLPKPLMIDIQSKVRQIRQHTRNTMLGRLFYNQISSFEDTILCVTTQFFLYVDLQPSLKTEQATSTKTDRH